MKLQLAALALLASSTSAFVANNVPFIKTLSVAENNYYNDPYKFDMYSRCELALKNTRPLLSDVQKIAGPAWDCMQLHQKNGTFCTVKASVKDMSTTEFALVTTKLCIKYDGFLQLIIEVPSNEQKL